MTGNRIGDEGAIAISEMLKVNTTLTKMCLGSEQDRKRKRLRRVGRNDDR